MLRGCYIMNNDHDNGEVHPLSRPQVEPCIADAADYNSYVTFFFASGIKSIHKSTEQAAFLDNS